MGFLPSDPARQKRVLIGILPIIAVFAYWYFVYQNETAEIADMQAHVEELDTRNRVARVQVQRGGPDLEKRVGLYQQYMTRLERLIPDREEVPELLHSMNLQAQENGVELAMMKPLEEQPTDYYTRQVYDMAVLGSYHDIGRFLSAIGSLPRIVAARDLALAPEAGTNRDGTQRLQATFRIETFVLPGSTPETHPSSSTEHGKADR